MTKSKIDWPTIHREFIAGVGVRELARRHSVSPGAVSKRAKKEGWTVGGRIELDEPDEGGNTLETPPFPIQETPASVSLPAHHGERRGIPGPGRPTKYDPNLCAFAMTFLAEDKKRTLTQLAAELGIDTDTIGNWRRKHKEFDRAVRIGLTGAMAEMEKFIADNFKDRDVNAKMVEMFMRNVHGWNNPANQQPPPGNNFVIIPPTAYDWLNARANSDGKTIEGAATPVDADDFETEDA